MQLEENAPAGHTVYTARAVDGDLGDNALISYSLANLNEIPFQVDANTGRISALRSLDYERDRREYNLRVRATDAGQPYRRASEMRLLIKLQPKNDNAPALRDLACWGHAVVARSVNSTAITKLMTLSAVDPDEGDVVTYRLLSDDKAIKTCFAVNRSTGDVTLQCGSPRRELMRYAVFGLIVLSWHSQKKRCI